jgi:murein DD-endopeptidase MepM/ murein hydrolase activator NlpD
MKRLIILYKYIVTYKSYMLTVALLVVGLAFYINYTQRIQTLIAVGSKMAKIDNIDNTTQSIYEMIKATKKTQDSMRVIVDHLPTGAPLHAQDISRVSSNFGYRFDPITKLWTFHGAKDFAVKQGTVIYATAAGTVVKAEMNASMGKYITINHQYGYQTTYGHLSSINALPGYIVKKGDPIAIAGNTGWSTGTHLHYVMQYVGKAINPDLLMQL